MKERIYSAIDGFLLDVDGVLLVENDAIDGAREAVKTLRDRGHEIRIVTNTTRHCRAEVAKRLRGAGIEFEDDELFTPAIVVRKYLLESGKTKCALVVHPELKEDFDGIEEDYENPDVVLMGYLDDLVTYGDMNRAFRLVHGGAEFLCLHKVRTWMKSDGLSLSAGPFVAAIEYATGVEAKPMGKPSRDFFHGIVDDMGVDPERAAMIGDDTESDVGGAQKVGLKGIQVRTGKYQEGNLERYGVEPDWTIDSIAVLAD
jgi:HAD superfamily hydrolase (TIGR01458 family)